MMLAHPSSTRLGPHYCNRAERIADGWVHGVGLGAAALGAILIIALSAWRGGLGQTWPILVYCICLLTMLTASAAYNLADRSRLRRVLRRVDHAAIFMMIAGSYTPLTVLRFEGAWAIAITLTVWAIALLGGAGKLFLPDISKRRWLALYVLLGWLVVVAIDPLIRSVSLAALILLAIGGVIYTSGVAVYVLDHLPFRRAIWHSFVLIAAGSHYAAIMIGVVLA